MPHLRTALPFTLLIALSFASHSAAQPEDDPFAVACRGIEQMIATPGDDALQDFADQYLAPAYRASISPQDLMTLLEGIRTAAADFGGVGLNVSSETAGQAVFFKPGEQVTVDFEIDPATGLISRLSPASVEKAPAVAPITWANLDTRLKEETAAGFSGSVLAVHNDSIVLYRGYGYADRDGKIPVDTNTIFAIGSTPIDFTHAAVLKLEETGRLSTTDSITRFLDNVPADKQGITIEDLMTGASGLPNFHDIPSDADPDLTWIDRATAIGRILGQKLLFAPGTDRRHSHSAWVLLAAIVELASGQPYEDYLRENFFGPAGMTRTGNYPIAAKFPADEIAIGYGSSQPTPINSPVYWGPTSWLVMGSGGMVSTPGDLYRWHVALRDGRLLGPTALAKYPLDAVGVGGNDRGFLNWFAFEGPDAVIMCSNSHVEMDDHAAQVGRALEQLVEKK